MPLLNSISLNTIYNDSTSSNNPSQIFLDWSRNSYSIDVKNPLNQKFSIVPGGNQVLFNNQRTLTIDGTTSFDILLNPALSSVYRIQHVGGTAPGFRTNRNVPSLGVPLTVTINNNATATISAGSVIFNIVQVGDTVFIPTTMTGDAGLNSPFDVNNGGYWTVIGSTSTSMTMTRLAGESFSGVSELVTPTNNLQLQVLTSNGVQVGDSVKINAGFSAVTQKTFVISALTAYWIEFTSTVPLPLESGIIPGATGLTIYTTVKKFVRIESDQDVVVRFNGDTSNNLILSPRSPASSSGIAWLDMWASVWKVEIVNKSPSYPVNVLLITAE